MSMDPIVMCSQLRRELEVYQKRVFNLETAVQVLLQRVMALEAGSKVSVQVGLEADLAAVQSETRAQGREERIQVLESTLADHEAQGVSETVHPEESNA